MKREQLAKRPNPGSDEALAQGCTCPVIDNGHGAGYMGKEGVFWIDEKCPMHWASGDVAALTRSQP